VQPLLDTTNQAAIIALFRVVNRYVGNLEPMPGVFPDYRAPIVRNGAEGRELAAARWGMPSSRVALALMEATKKRAAKQQAKGKLVTETQMSITITRSKVLMVPLLRSSRRSFVFADL
jgi:putative SOS response-associated peptidase YedK